MSDRSPRPALRRAPGGHEARLAFSEGVALGRPVMVRELDPADDAVAHEVLSDVMAEHAAGTITTFVRYRGKHPRRWFDQLYPPSCDPRVLGFFFPDGTLLGWITATRSPAVPGQAVLGMVVRPPYRDAGLGTAAILHVQKHLHRITRDGSMAGVFFETEERNRRVRHVARKLRAAPAGVRIDALKGGAMMLQFTSKHETLSASENNSNNDDDDPTGNHQHQQQRHAPVPA
ncbi:MAG: GNAT family N-acetyltransferase [Candidatus Sigynarchaeota archaeon]